MLMCFIPDVNSTFEERFLGCFFQVFAARRSIKRYSYNGRFGIEAYSIFTHIGSASIKKESTAESVTPFLIGRRPPFDKV